jgi:hypothetical protein
MHPTICAKSGFGAKERRAGSKPGKSLTETAPSPHNFINVRAPARSQPVGLRPAACGTWLAASSAPPPFAFAASLAKVPYRTPSNG